MLITLKEKNKAYLGNFLWIPKDAISPSQLKNLEFEIKPYVPTARFGKIKITFYDDCGTHYRVPRYFRDFDRSVPVIDIRPTNFQKLDISDKIHDFIDEAQATAWENFEQGEEGILNLACGRGKTVLAIKKAVSRQFPFIVITNQVTTLAQWEKAIRTFTDYTGPIGIVRGSECNFDPPIVLASAQTLLKRPYIPPEITHKFGTVIFDEAHHYAAPLLRFLLPRFWGVRYGLTATLQRQDGLEVMLMAHIGPVIYSDLYQPLKPEIFVKATPIYVNLNSHHIKDTMGGLNVTKLIGLISRIAARNEIIIRDVLELAKFGYKVLVLTQIKQHAVWLASHIPGAGFVTGSTRQNERLKIFKSRNVICATLGIAKEAIDIPDLSAVVFATPFKSWPTFQQAIGRALRVHEGKKKPIVLLYRDTLIRPLDGLCRNLMQSMQNHGYQYQLVQHEVLDKILRSLEEDE